MAAKPEPTQLEKEQVCVRPSFLCILFFFFFVDIKFVVRLKSWFCGWADVRDDGEGDGVPGRSFQPVSDTLLVCFANCYYLGLLISRIFQEVKH